MAWLKYGLDSHQQLVAIEVVPRGRSTLSCPYCGDELTAKKGNQKDHHFAHTHLTCRFIAQRQEVDPPLLPLYDKFHLSLSSAALQEVQQLWQRYGSQERSVPTPNHHSLIQQGCLTWNSYRGRSGGFEFTKLGKIPVGALSLRLFNDL
jgi:Competence protein CoiA-like family